jgi:hypothetical protein
MAYGKSLEAVLERSPVAAEPRIRVDQPLVASDAKDPIAAAYQIGAGFEGPQAVRAGAGIGLFLGEASVGFAARIESHSVSLFTIGGGFTDGRLFNLYAMHAAIGHLTRIHKVYNLLSNIPDSSRPLKPTAKKHKC